MRYVKKPVIVDAFEVYDFYHTDVATWPKWMIDFLNLPEMEENSITFDSNGNIFINTLEGKMKANDEDWIIKGIKGEAYPCKRDIFEATYNEAPE